MIPKSMADWYQSVEDRFDKLKSKMSRLEGEMIVIITMLAIVLAKVLS